MMTGYKRKKNIFITRYGTELPEMSWVGQGVKIFASFCIGVFGVGLVSWYSFADSSIPNNTSLEYPLRQVSTVECRSIARNEHNDACKISLPRIA